MQKENPLDEGLQGNLEITSIGNVGGRKNHLSCLGSLSVTVRSVVVAVDVAIGTEFLIDIGSATTVMSRFVEEN